jgi:hypothetical protein
MSHEEKLLIDRYLNNTLTGLELRDFLNRLETDENFKKQVSFHNKLIEGIIRAEDRRLIHEIEKAIGYRKPAIPFALKLIFTFLFITISGIVLWNYIGPDSTGKKRNYFSWNFIRNNQKPALKEPEEITSKTTTLSKVDSPLIQSPPAASESIVETFDSSEVPENTADIIVKKDQLLISYHLKPIQLNGDNMVSSEAGGTADKLNPEAGLPSDEKINGYDVEFWVSPVNYKGYKLINNKLILFGIEAPDEVQLYTTEKNLWMKYGSDFYTLEKNDNFESFVQLNDIPPLK